MRPLLVIPSVFLLVAVAVAAYSETEGDLLTRPASALPVPAEALAVPAVFVGAQASLPQLRYRSSLKTMPVPQNTIDQVTKPLEDECARPGAPTAPSIAEDAYRACVQRALAELDLGIVVDAP